MSELLFFYGTLMSGFQREGRVLVEDQLKSTGRGSIAAALYDLGAYPGAIVAIGSRVRGEVYRMLDADRVLAVLDEFEGYRASDPSTSLYTREETAVTLEDGMMVSAWVYFYNAPLGTARRIESGDYLEYLNGK